MPFQELAYKRQLKKNTCYKYLTNGSDTTNTKSQSQMATESISFKLTLSHQISSENKWQSKLWHLRKVRQREPSDM